MTFENTHRPPVRLAILGLGRAVFEEHWPILKNHPSLFKLVAACDLIKERRDIIAKDAPDCKMFRRVSDMLDERDIDAVVVATPTSLHVKHALMSLKRGFWTILETPMALTPDEAQIVRGQALKSKNRIIVLQRGSFDPDFELAKQMMSDERLGTIHEIHIRREDYIRRDDWQCVKRLGGGAAYYAMTDLMIQALRLLPSRPIQMWSDLKRLASLGDAEDYARTLLKTREQVTAEVIFNGGSLPNLHGPSFEIHGSRGVFRVNPGEKEGSITMIDPKFKFPRRRSSVRTPQLLDMHEQFPVVEASVSLPKNSQLGMPAFWKNVYQTVRTAATFPLALEDSIEAVRLAHLMKQTSPYGK